MPRKRSARSTREQGESVTQAFQDLINGEHSGSHCGELNRERHPIETPAEPDNGRTVRIGELESV